MASADQVLRIIQDAAEFAQSSHPEERQMRIEAFVCYLSGALKGPYADAAPLSEIAFSLFKDAATPAATTEAPKT